MRTTIFIFYIFFWKIRVFLVRYQPATSLSSQLRAEREVRQQQHLLSVGNGKKNSVPSESQYEKPRTLNELMSPRLVQRRIQQQVNRQLPW